jgi:type III secretory pathway component EscT
MALPDMVTAALADPFLTCGLVARMAAAVAAGCLPLAACTTLRIRAAVVLGLVVTSLPTAAATARPEPPPWPLLLVGEACVGLGLGLAAAVAIAAATWAGGLLGSVAGLSWADDFDPDGDAQGAGMARLAWWLGVAGFFLAGGHLAVVGGLVDAARWLPIGGVFTATGGVSGWTRVVTTLPMLAVSLAVALALPALAAVVAFHVASAVCLRTVRFAPGQGLLQAAAAVVLLAAVMLGSDVWIGPGGFGDRARAQVEQALTADTLTTP